MRRRPLRASADCSRSLNSRTSSSIRATISSGAARISRREAATASAGRAAISRAAFMASASTSPGGTTALTRPQACAAAASSGRPITRSSNARRCPIRRGASRLEAASGTRPRLTNGVEKRASVPATTWSQCSSMVVPTPTARPCTAATSGRSERASAWRKWITGVPDLRRTLAACANSARSLPAENAPGAPAITTQRMSCVAVGAFQRGRHRLVHRGGQRVLLVRAVHPHGADRPRRRRR